MKTTTILTPGVRVQGATYIGICTAANGSLYALLRLNEKPESRRSFQEQLAWAKSLNADLPTKPEAALICALQKPDSGWYWTKDKLDASSAWYFISSGLTFFLHKSAAGGALAVRRLTLQSFYSWLELARSIEVES